ncbi:MAG: allose kinase [Anaerolineaceae bacterium]
MNREKVVVGVDVGGTHIRVGAVAEDNALIKDLIVFSSTVENKNTSVGLLNLIGEFIDGSNIDVQAVSIGFPATLNKARTTVISSPNLKGLDGKEIKNSYQEKLGIPVFIEKDACMLLYNDLEKYKIDKTGIIIGFYVGTGLGNIILIDGKPLVGRDGVACELGHIPIIGKDDLCSCGLVGCLELYAGGKSLERIRKERFSKTQINKIFTEHGDDEEIRALVKNIAIAVVTEINILNPDSIILSGGVLGMENFPYAELIMDIKNMARKPIPGENLNIVRADTSNPFNGVIGAAIFARAMLNKKEQ